ncbi:MAG: hypothetical protein HYS38_08190, partial [Acidobacteria bacterium]|nr:hypothetical protein [Acidobacteriota bacterium]
MAEPDVHLTPQLESIQEGKRSAFLWTAVGLLFVIGTISAVFFLMPPPESPLVPPPSQEDIAYVRQLQLGELHLSAEKNFLDQRVVYLDGKISNRGNKTVRQLKLRLFFRDYYGQVVLQEDQPVLAETAAPLGPGQTRDFQLRFDRIPDSWSQQIPQFQLV